MNRQKILVVEDNKSHLDNAVEQLSDRFDLTTAKNFDSGLDALDKEKFNFLLTDLMMPKGTGRTMGNKGMELIFDEMPYGFPLAIYATKKEVSIISIVTDIGHHDHPMAYSFDYIRGIYRINNSMLEIRPAPMIKNGEKYVKDWTAVLYELSRINQYEVFPELKLLEDIKNTIENLK